MERNASQTTQVQGRHVSPKSSNISPLDLDLCNPHTAGRTTEDVNPSFCSPLIWREQNGDSLFFLHMKARTWKMDMISDTVMAWVCLEGWLPLTKKAVVCSFFCFIIFLFLFPGKICQSLYMEANAWTFNQGLAGFSNVDLLLWIWPASPLSLARET